MAMKYGNLMDDVVAFITLVQATGSDGKVTKTERGKMISAASKLIRKIQDAR
jgi:antirestriction protein ArdC